ncbi:TniQ family protein [Bacillus sp. JJ664]
MKSKIETLEKDFEGIQNPSNLYTKRSRLYNIEPINVGNLMVESLTSYLSRLAIAHCVYISDLFFGEIEPLFQQKRTKEYRVNKLNSINGYNYLAKECVRAIELLTHRNDIKYLTLLHFEGIISGGNKEFISTYKKFCPMCLYDFKLNETKIYEPLLWQIKGVNTCPIHLIKLIDKCGKCKKQSKVIFFKSRPGYCQHCNEWLGNDNEIENATLSMYDKAFKDLLENILILPKYNREEIRKSLISLVNSYDSFKKFSLDILGKESSSLPSSWINNAIYPEFETLLQISTKLNSSLLDFIDKDQSRHIIKNVEGIKKSKQYLIVEKILEEIQKTNKEFFSFECLLRKTNVNKEYLIRNFAIKISQK